MMLLAALAIAHQARGAHAVDRHAAHALGQARGVGAQAAEVVALVALLRCDAQHHVVDIGPVHAGLGQRGTDHVATEHGRFGVVEGTSVGAADRGARRGDYNRFLHGHEQTLSRNTGG
jgi:hypothetical protein